MPSDRCLLGVGARVLRQLRRPETVSRLWETLMRDGNEAVPYDWFILSLDLLFVVGAVDFIEGRVQKVPQ
jgi:hypothetical protein